MCKPVGLIDGSPCSILAHPSVAVPTRASGLPRIHEITLDFQLRGRPKHICCGPLARIMGRSYPISETDHSRVLKFLLMHRSRRKESDLKQCHSSTCGAPHTSAWRIPPGAFPPTHCGRCSGSAGDPVGSSGLHPAARRCQLPNAWANCKIDLASHRDPPYTRKSVAVADSLKGATTPSVGLSPR